MQKQVLAWSAAFGVARFEKARFRTTPIWQFEKLNI
jgi:hypothetical protein